MIKIRYGTNWNTDNLGFAFLLTFILYFIIIYQSDLQNRLDECQKSIAQSRGQNITKSFLRFYCEFPIEYCLCPISINASNSSEICITNFEVTVARILPFVSYFLHIIVFRQMFSLTGNHRRFIIYALWAICIIIFIDITITISSSSCFQVYIVGIQFFTVGPLNIFSFILIIKGNERRDARSYHNRTNIAHSSETVNRERKLWKELL